MFKGTGRLFGSGNGIVKSPFYKTGGVFQFRGMRNRRSSHREKIRRAKMARQRAIEEAGAEFSEGFGFGD